MAVTLPTIAVDSSAQRTPIIHFSLFIIHLAKRLWFCLHRRNGFFIYSALTGGELLIKNE